MQNPFEMTGVTSLGCIERPALSLITGECWPILDRCPRAPGPPNFLGPSDLVLGQVANINGRQLRLVECDAFTARYCKEELGIGK